MFFWENYQDSSIEFEATPGRFAPSVGPFVA